VSTLAGTFSAAVRVQLRGIHIGLEKLSPRKILLRGILLIHRSVCGEMVRPFPHRVATLPQSST
jgi:hypothetical protein